MKKQLVVALVVLAALLGLTRRAAAAADFIVTISGMSAYVIGGQNNPPLTLTRGTTYVFDIQASNHPFFIKTVQEIGSDNTFDTGVTNNGASPGTLTFTVPANAPAKLYYQCVFHDIMTGVINIVSPPASSPVPATTDVTIGLVSAGLALLGFAALGGAYTLKRK